HRRHRECRMFPQLPCRKPQIVHEDLDTVFPPVLARPLPRSRHASHLSPHRLLSLVRRKPARSPVGLGLLEVLCYLIGNILLAPRSAPQTMPPIPKLPPK